MTLLKDGLIPIRTVEEEARDVISDVTILLPLALSCRITIVTNPLSPLVSEIFDLKVADIHKPVGDCRFARY